MTTFNILQEVKNKLSEIDTIKSLKIGFEKGANIAKNTPMCRIITETTTAKGGVEDLTFQIVVAFDLKNDIEKLYEEFYSLESIIKDKMYELPFKLFYINTIMDEDRLTNLKAGILRYKIADLGLN